jgi:RNA polymerase sigma factor (sigma-70 family)
MSGDFETEWRQVRPKVWAYCCRAARDQNDAEDIFQQVAIRAWRGFSSFRGDAQFLTWALSIARREVTRVLGGRSHRARSETSLELLTEEAPGALPTTEAPEPPGPGEGWVAEAARQAVDTGGLTPMESAIVLLRLADPEATWEQIGHQHGMEGGACAVAHCRALPKLRVFLFTQRPHLLGGAPAIAQAFEAARGDPAEPLHPEEAETFRRIVLEGQTNYRKAGWRVSLRSACAKVVKKLALP